MDTREEKRIRKVLVLSAISLLYERAPHVTHASRALSRFRESSFHQKSLGRFRPAILRRTRDFLQFRPPFQNLLSSRETDEQEPFVFVQSLRWIINFWTPKVSHKSESVRNNAQIPRGNAGAPYRG